MLSRHISQLRHPRLHVVTMRIIVLRLLHDVERAIARVRADACPVRPIARVRAHVVVDQVGLKVFGAPPPVNFQLVGEEGAYVLAAAVGHVARVQQFAHLSAHVFAS